MINDVRFELMGSPIEVAREARAIAQALAPVGVDLSSTLAVMARMFRAYPAPEGHKIQFIKAVREVTGCGLKEAKDVVEGVTP